MGDVRVHVRSSASMRWTSARIKEEVFKIGTFPSPTNTAPAAGVAAHHQPPKRASPGVSLRKRVLTGLGIALVVALFLFIAWYGNASMLVSIPIGLTSIEAWPTDACHPARSPVANASWGIVRAEAATIAGTRGLCSPRNRVCTSTRADDVAGEAI
jgi:hypothetical protein